MESKQLEEKLNQLHQLIVNMNAFGSIDLSDLIIIESFIKGSFGIELKDK